MSESKESGLAKPREINFENLREDIWRFAEGNYHPPTHLIIEKYQFLDWAKDAFWSIKINMMNWTEPLYINLDGVKLRVMFCDNLAAGEYFLTWSGKNE